jgi:hypothetical protein
MNKTYGQIAYEAYFESCGGKSLISGAPLPEWPAQSDAIKKAWEAAGDAVAIAGY